MCTIQYQTDKWIEKWVEEQIRHFFPPKNTYRWPTGTWKDPQYHNHQGNANQSHCEISTHTYQNGYRQKASMSGDVKQRWQYWTVGWVYKFGAATMENNRGS